MLMKELIKPLTLRSGQDAETERQTTWFELFSDEDEPSWAEFIMLGNG